MSIETKELIHIAQLARIQLDKKEEVKLVGELTNILDYIGKLNEVPTENISPLSQVNGIVNNYRKESEILPLNTAQEENRAELLNSAPEKENNLFKVRSILNK